MKRVMAHAGMANEALARTMRQDLVGTMARFDTAQGAIQAILRGSFPQEAGTAEAL